MKYISILLIHLRSIIIIIYVYCYKIILEFILEL